MKKKIFFLIIMALILTPFMVKAESYSFYEAEYVSDIYMNRAPLRGSNVTYYQRARFFRNKATQEFAYCIEPFRFFTEEGSYSVTNSPIKLTQEKIRNLSLISHFGFGYKNHTDVKWYAITQFMIWKEADPEGDYYFTQGLNGQRINRFESEMEEIRNLINNYNTNPSFANNTYEIVEENNLLINDNNKVLDNYKIINKIDFININNNKLEINNLKEGTYKIELERYQSVYNKPALFYEANNSQNLITTGDIFKKQVSLNISVKKTNVKINKKDKETNSFVAQGDAKLENSVFNIYNGNMELIDKYKIGKNKQIEIDNLNYGKYYIKEETPGEGYLLNEETYSFEITKDNPHVEVNISNEVIKSKLTIKKLYGTDNNFKNEPNISFNIFNSNHELVKTIITNEEGIANITLPYGKYYIEQLTTTEGYEKISNQEISVESIEDINIEFKDFKINVPNTKSQRNIFEVIINLFKSLLC